MTTGTQQRHAPRWVGPFLAAVIAALAVILLGTAPSASAAATAETRVGTINHTIEPAVGPPQHIAAGQRRDATLQQPGFVVATGVAAKSADEALAGVDDVLGGLAQGRNSGVRTVSSDAELDEVYRSLTRGGTPVDVPGYTGTWIERGDGVRVGIRDAFKSGGRTIDIRHPEGTTRKVHIE